MDDNDENVNASSRNLFSLPTHCAHHELGLPTDLSIRTSNEPHRTLPWINISPRRSDSEIQPVTPTRQQKQYSLYLERTVPRSLAKAMMLDELLSVQTAHARLQTSRTSVPKEWWQSKNDVLRSLVADVDHIDLEGANERRRRHAMDVPEKK